MEERRRWQMALCVGLNINFIQGDDFGIITLKIVGVSRYAAIFM